MYKLALANTGSSPMKFKCEGEDALTTAGQEASATKDMKKTGLR
jgi:hypothetical protein